MEGIILWSFCLKLIELTMITSVSDHLVFHLIWSVCMVAFLCCELRSRCTRHQHIRHVANMIAWNVNYDDDLNVELTLFSSLCNTS